MASMNFKRLQEKINEAIATANELSGKIGKCKNCRHWDHSDDAGAACSSPKKVMSAGALEILPELTGDQCLVDGEAYGGKLYTGPEFGCLHFEPIEIEE